MVSSTQKANNILEFLHICENLKRTKRTGWIERNCQGPESISDHMHRMGIIAMLLPDGGSMDKTRILKMAIVHDLTEALTGDIAPSSNMSKKDKFKLENDAMEQMVNLLGRSNEILEIQSLWLEYEAAETSEALFVKDLDKFEMIVQAFEYERRDKIQLDTFFESTFEKFKHPMIKDLVKALYEKRGIPIKKN